MKFGLSGFHSSLESASQRCAYGIPFGIPGIGIPMEFQEFQMRGGFPAVITYIFTYTYIEWRVCVVLRVTLDPCMIPDSS